ncbi:MAG: trypsin-like peptidase domain-containing protein [Thermoguttaceae bacterium]
MKRMWMLCLLSAVLGGLAALGWRATPLAATASSAQENPVWPGPTAAPAAPAPAAVAAAPGAFDSLTPDEQVNVFVYQQANRSVVNINTKADSVDRLLMFEIVAATEGEGSGMVIDKLGHVLTNFHVIEGAREIRVTLYDGKTYDARLVGGDPDTDVAVLRIVEAPPESLYPVTFGTSSNLLVGQRVFAIGNPFGLERTLTTGIVASLDRSLPPKHGRRSLKSIIQIDAAINPGNSGGPLLDTHARLIGMNTAIASKTGESAGVGFAIPVNTIARIVPQLVQNGRVRRPETGIARIAKTDRGLLVLALTPGGPAERAGLQGPKIEKRERRQGPFVTTYQTLNVSAADMIVAVDGRPVKTADDFLDAIESKQSGDQVTITVVRAGQQRQVPLKLETAQ